MVKVYIENIYQKLLFVKSGGNILQIYGFFNHTWYGSVSPYHLLYPYLIEVII
jgi:hypothetical protein